MFRRAFLIVILLTLTGCSWFLPRGVEVPAVPPTDKILSVRVLSEPLDEPVPDPVDDENTTLPPPAEGQIDILEWTREVFTETNTERISLKLQNEYVGADFYVVFAGYRMNEEMEPAFISDTMYAPPNWNGTLTFDIPLGDYYRLYGASVWTKVDNVHNGDFWARSAVGFAPPCPDYYPWPAGYTYEDCLAEVGETD